MRVGGFNNTNKIINLYNNSKSIENKESRDKNKIKDSIEISQLGKSLSTYTTSEDDIINSSQKVEKIKEEISKGIYNRDSKLIADSILKAIKEQK